MTTDRWDPFRQEKRMSDSQAALHQMLAPKDKSKEEAAKKRFNPLTRDNIQESATQKAVADRLFGSNDDNDKEEN